MKGTSGSTLFEDIYSQPCSIESQDKSPIFPAVLQAGESKIFQMLRVYYVSRIALGLVYAKVNSGYKMNQLELLETLFEAEPDRGRRQYEIEVL